MKYLNFSQIGNAWKWFITTFLSFINSIIKNKKWKFCSRFNIFRLAQQAGLAFEKKKYNFDIGKGNFFTFERGQLCVKNDIEMLTLIKAGDIKDKESFNSSRKSRWRIVFHFNAEETQSFRISIYLFSGWKRGKRISETDPITWL